MSSLRLINTATNKEMIYGTPTKEVYFNTSNYTIHILYKNTHSTCTNN